MSDSQQHDQGGLVARTLAAVSSLLVRRPLIAIFGVTILCAAAGTFSAINLKIKTDRADLIDPNTDYQRRWLNYTKNFGDVEDLVVVLESNDPAALRVAMEDLADKLSQETRYFRNVLFRIDPSSLASKGLQYLDPGQLEQILSSLSEFGPVLKGQWDALSLRSLFQGIQHRIRLGSQSPDNQQNLQAALGLALRLTEGLDQFARSRRQEYASPWNDLLAVDQRNFARAQEVRYLVNAEGTMGFVTAKPVLTGQLQGATESVDRVRQLMREVESRHAGIRAGLTGIPVLECDEMRSSEQAMILESIVSYTAVSLLLIFGFRGFRHPLIAMTMLGIGMTCAFGFATLAVGHLNILSVSFVAIVIGLGIDYAILFLSRYMEIRRSGTAVQPAVIETSRQVGPGILTASLTTSIAFLCAIFSDFLGVSELGLIAGGGILLCALAALFVMPPLVAFVDRRAKPKQLPTPFQVAWLRELIWKKPGVVVAVSIAAVVWITAHGGRVRYDYNLLNLQSQKLESVRLQSRIAEKSDNRLLYAVSLANSPEEAKELKRRFEALPTVHHVDEIASMMPSRGADQTQLLVQGIQVLLGRLPERGIPQFGAVDPKSVGQQMDDLFFTLEAVNLEIPDSKRLRSTLDRFLDRLDQLPFDQQVALLTDYQTRIAADLLTRLRMLSSVADSEPVGVADLPAGIAGRFVGKQGQWLLQIHPNEQLWEIEPLRKFAADIRSVDPDVTGTPLQNLEALQQIRQGYETIAVYALLASFVVLLIDFVRKRDAILALSVPLAGVGVLIASSVHSNLEIVPSQLALAYVLISLTLVAVLDIGDFCHIFLAMLPPLVGGAMTVGLLGLTGVNLNPANLIILPLILGIGVDNGVHVMHDYRHQTGRYQCSPSLVNALFLTSFANMSGFASMILAAHQGLKSIGLVLTIGVASCLFVSVVLLPSILTLISARRIDPYLAELPPDADDIHDPHQPLSLHLYHPETTDRAA